MGTDKKRDRDREEESKVVKEKKKGNGERGERYKKILILKSANTP